MADLSQFFSILSDLECYRTTFSSFTNHLGNAKSKDQSKKSSKENTFFQIVKHGFFHFSSFWPLLLSNLITFLFLNHFKKKFKCYRSITWSSTNHLGILIAIEQHTKKFFGVLGTGLCSVQWFVFLKFLDPLYFGGL